MLVWWCHKSALRGWANAHMCWPPHTTMGTWSRWVVRHLFPNIKICESAYHNGVLSRTPLWHTKNKFHSSVSLKIIIFCNDFWHLKNSQAVGVLCCFFITAYQGLTMCVGSPGLTKGSSVIHHLSVVSTPGGFRSDDWCDMGKPGRPGL